MSSRIIIAGVSAEVSAEYIAIVFARQHIAQVRSVTLIPYFVGSMLYNRAYVVVWSWSASESAYNFLRRLSGKEEARIVYHDDNYWVVKPNMYIVPTGIEGTTTATFSYTLYENGDDLSITLAERNLAAAERDLEFQRDFGDDYERTVECEYAFDVALYALRDLRFKETQIVYAEQSPNITLRSHQQLY